MENQIAELKKELAALQLQLKTHQVAFEMLAAALEPNVRQSWADLLEKQVVVARRTNAEIAAAELPLTQSILALRQKLIAPLSLS
ncbi:hypothetical protein [Gallibacterium anatis]|uniref:hypothetical protein n=1 Tax=Gallibacterium anatis TaxID=750 RepID=UPI0018B0154A|nr:hypothetical protein [Gallibacterium anatis]